MHGARKSNGTNYFLLVWYDYMSATGEHQLKTFR